MDVKRRSRARIDLTNQRFGKLVAIKRVEDYISPNGSHQSQWECKCDCGNEVIVVANSLRRGLTKSCGCLAKEITSKLKSINTTETKSTLFSVADTLAQTYNNHYKKGLTKEKVALAIDLGRKMELSKEDIDKLKIAMLLYDIGKLMIPDDILNKKEPLSIEEKQKTYTSEN